MTDDIWPAMRAIAADSRLEDFMHLAVELGPEYLEMAGATLRIGDTGQLLVTMADGRTLIEPAVEDDD